MLKKLTLVAAAGICSFGFLQEGNAQVPVISSFTPVSGPVGTTVTIVGNGFDPVTTNNVVLFGTVRSEILSATSSQITARLLAGSPSVTPIVVTNLVSQKTGSSITVQPSNFTITHPGEGVDVKSYAPSSYAVGNVPFSITSADFNADGQADVATANFDANTVSVLVRNSANDGFNVKIDIPVSATPRMIISADFNGDGNPDIASASDGAVKKISVLIRNSNPIESAGFTLEPYVSANLTINAIAAGDIDGDGRTDLIAANGSSNTVSVFLRNSTNTGFALAGNYGVGDVLTNIIASDLNGDGKLDIATTSWGSNVVSVLMRNAANTGFDAPLNYPTGVKPRGLNVGDFNGDGKPDIVVANHGSYSVSVLLRNSSNTDFVQTVNYSVGIYAQWATVGDLNGDGSTDLIINGFQVTDPNSANIFIMLNDGSGTFQNTVGFRSNGLVRSVTIGDFNGDGMSDFVAANNNLNDVTLFESTRAIWTGEVSVDWSLPDNWWNGHVPGELSEAVIASCGTCPRLASAVEIRRLLMTNARLDFNGNSISVSEDTSIEHSEISGQGSLISKDIFEFSDNIVKDELTVIKTGGVENSWKGNNSFKRELNIINSSVYRILFTLQPNKIE